MWFLFVLLYILLAVIFTQFYKITTKSSKNPGALTVIGNVIVGYFFLNERDNLLKKIIAAIMIIVSVILIKG